MLRFGVGRGRDETEVLTQRRGVRKVAVRLRGNGKDEGSCNRGRRGISKRSYWERNGEL